ncbi:MAG: shikimate dehydrogenase [Burkholderiaceae bacterium]|nr:shikimate dehydrogenase [Burkholderiaceae bacterium]
MTTPDRYAVIGNPIAHSQSPEIHARFAAQTGQNLTYERLLAPLDGFAAVVRAFIANGGRGLNVTVPFKLEAYAMATSLTNRARIAGAVNTLIFGGDEIVGDNTDGIGLVNDIVHNAGVTLAGKRLLLLGAGGAARGVIQPLIDVTPAELIIANRTLSKAKDLAGIFSMHTRIPLSACAFGNLQGPFDVVINATSTGLTDEMPDVPASICGHSTLAYDMVYGKKPSPFLQFAAKRGAATRDGLGMLVEQAAESFFVWRGVRPDTAPVLAALRALLQA